NWLTEADGPEQDFIYMGLHNKQNAWRAVWDGEYMLSSLDYKLFYDYKNDPYETNNLYLNPDTKELQKKYENALIEMAEKTQDPIINRLKETLSDHYPK
ncbi:MAG: hypothetical protein R3182_06835, partial [Draconibacterium sp.]|nr:hypothetical protein [Draconibacterium sp.]